MYSTVKMLNFIPWTEVVALPSQVTPAHRGRLVLPPATAQTGVAPPVSSLLGAEGPQEKATGKASHVQQPCTLGTAASLAPRLPGSAETSLALDQPV